MLEINLLPWREQRRKKQEVILNRLILAVLIGVCLLYVFLHLYMQSAIVKKEKKVVYLNHELRKRSDQVEKIKIIQGKYENLLNAYQSIKQIQNSEKYFIDLLTGMINQTPPEILLTFLSKQEGAIRLMGQAYSSVALGRWIKKSPQAKLIEVKNPSQTVLNFQIAINY